MLWRKLVNLKSFNFEAKKVKVVFFFLFNVAWNLLYNGADVKKKWENSSWGRKLIVQKRRASLNDFDRFKLMLAKIKVSKVLSFLHCIISLLWFLLRRVLHFMYNLEMYLVYLLFTLYPCYACLVSMSFQVFCIALILSQIGVILPLCGPYSMSLLCVQN